jgi:hypothetical protein
MIELQTLGVLDAKDQNLNCYMKRIMKKEKNEWKTTSR